MAPRTFAERPKSPLVSPNSQPANDNDPVLGTWENGQFCFTSPEARQKWRRKSYEQGVGEDNWHLGKEMDAKSTAIVQSGLGGANSGHYQGPDGKYRLMTPKTIESQAARDHRNKYLTGKTIDQLAAAKAMPGVDEWVEQGKEHTEQSPHEFANNGDGSTEELSKQLQASVPYGGRFAAMPNQSQETNSEKERPSLTNRFEASAKRAFIDGTGFGASIQAFKSGYARSPDVLATRPPDRFLQSGSKGAADWYRMYEPLGIAGGKRRIDLLSSEERKQWQTEWEALSAKQQAAYRIMWEEKQREFLPWRAFIDREIYLPPPESKVERLTDFLGAMTGSMVSPENWIGMELGAAATSVRGTALSAADAAVVGARNVDNLVGVLGEATGEASLRKLDNLAENASPIAPISQSVAKDTRSVIGETPPSLRAELEIAKKKHYTLKEAYNLPEPHNGIIYVKEKASGSADWIEFMKGHPDVIWLPETQEFAVPALRYVNPNTNGKHLIRLDAAGLLGDLETVVLTDTKTQMAVWSAKTRDTLLRLREALRQNPGYGKVIYEVKTEIAAKKARDFIESNNFTDIIIVKVRQQ